MMIQGWEVRGEGGCNNMVGKQATVATVAFRLHSTVLWCLIVHGSKKLTNWSQLTQCNTICLPSTQNTVHNSSSNTCCSSAVPPPLSPWGYHRTSYDIYHRPLWRSRAWVRPRQGDRSTLCSKFSAQNSFFSTSFDFLDGNPGRSDLSVMIFTFVVWQYIKNIDFIDHIV